MFKSLTYVATYKYILVYDSFQEEIQVKGYGWAPLIIPLIAVYKKRKMPIAKSLAELMHKNNGSSKDTIDSVFCRDIDKLAPNLNFTEKYSKCLKRHLDTFRHV